MGETGSVKDEMLHRGKKTGGLNYEAQLVGIKQSGANLVRDNYLRDEKRKMVGGVDCRTHWTTIRT